MLLEAVVVVFMVQINQQVSSSVLIELQKIMDGGLWIEVWNIPK
jgi:hypothetical protein